MPPEREGGRAVHHITSGGYAQFPGGNRHRVTLGALRDEQLRDRLRTIWTDPMALDPSRTAARVTREIARHLAGLGKWTDAAGWGHPPHRFTELQADDSVMRDQARGCRGRQRPIPIVCGS
ncbi:hypothetical protein LNKW23_06680 [Paralimibaculum aggregatum]|uniref:Uncharacterized protein n=1 Tax=Paralimibaculum aggregatum TaxID=3036245 RepID=A0ABQ6LGV5_9RHOB|nr:hypothetical protein LNKW23_06680 [Limibaculum sp. NKW23]